MSFGQLLQRYRALAELTQDQLAERSGYSTDYIGKLERNQRRPARAAVDRLVTVLALAEVDATALRASASRQRIAGPQPDVHPPTAIPALPLPIPPTPLIGRTAERVAVQAALHASRLVTLTGVGGTGKTRLALQVALDAAPDDYPHGVAFADLASIRDSALIAPAILLALGLPEHRELGPEAHLVSVLRPCRFLLVIDNMEHLLDEAPLLSRLLATAPGLHILVTSRVPLHLYGEHEVRLPQLTLPILPPGRDSSTTFLDPLASEAVQLFIARASAAVPGFAPAAEALDAVAGICVALDGLPLAIELAAARTNLFPPEALLPRLEGRLTLLIDGPRDRPQRHQTIRTALDWSYELLPAAEQELFASLSVFAGSFDSEAAACVCEEGRTPAGGAPRWDDAGDGMVLRLMSLTDASLLEVMPGHLPRFRMLETVRAYALDRLVATGRLERVQARQLRYFAGLAERLNDTLLGDEQVATVARFDAEHDNFRAALVWARESGAVEAGLRLAGALGRFWRLRGYFREGLEWLEALLAASAQAPEEEEPAVRARALNEAGAMAWRLGGYARATVLLSASLDIWRQEGDPSGMAQALDSLGNVASRQGDFDHAMTMHQQALTLRRDAGDPRGVSITLGNLGRVALQRGDAALAQRLLEENLTLRRELRDTVGIANALTSLGRVAARQGDYVRAAALLEESVALKRTFGDRHGRITSLALWGWVAFSQGDTGRARELLREGLHLAAQIGARDRVPEILETLASVAAANGQFHEAAQVGGSADALRRTLGVPLPADRQGGHDKLLRETAAALGGDTFAATWTEGAARPLEDVVAELLVE